MGRVMKKIFDFLNRFFQLEEINGDGLCPTYLYRWTLFRLGWFKVYLHHFIGDDWTLDLHDHPKRFVSIGLKGQYVEETPGRERIYIAPWFRTFPASHIHRLRMIDGGDCWTVVAVFKSTRPWGFWNNGTWIPWRQYLQLETASERKSCAE